MSTPCLYNPSLLNEDMRILRMGPLAQLLFAKLAAIANANAGYIRLKGEHVSLMRIGLHTGFKASICDYAVELATEGLLARDQDNQWYIPDIKKAHDIREKRRSAGRKGGRITAERRKQK